MSRTTHAQLLVRVGIVAMCGLIVTGSALAQQKDLRIPAGEDGLFRKVIVRSDRALFYEQLGGKGEPITAFTVYHQLWADNERESEEKDGFIHVGKATGAPLGWIKKTDVEQWNTRFVLDPQLPSADAVFQVFDAPNGTKPKLEDLKTVKAKYTGLKAGFRSMVPILEKPDDAEDPPVFKVVFFAGSTQSATETPGSGPEVDLKDLKLEVVFVIDTTASMTPLLDGTKEVVRQVAQAVAANPELKGAVRLGLVEYQDATPGLKPANLVARLTDDLDGFQKSLAPLKVAGMGSQETAEDVLAGLKMGIEQAGWDKISSKHIILLGDASAHLGDPKVNPKNTTGLSIKEVLDLGRRGAGPESEKQLASVNFHAVRAEQPADPDDAKIAERHFREVARNNGDFEGYYSALDPNNENDRKRVVTEVVQKLKAAFDPLVKARQGKAKPVSPEQLKNASPFEMAINRVIDATTGEVLPVERGWATERNDKQRQVAKKKILISETELHRLQNTLDFLYKQFATKVEPDERGNIEDLLAVLQQAAAGAEAGQMVQKDDKLLKFISALPLKSDALEITPKELAGYNVQDFKAWLEKLQRTHRRAQTIAETADWINLDNGKTKERYTFLLLGELP